MLSISPLLKKQRITDTEPKGDWSELAEGSFRAKPGRVSDFCGLGSRIDMEGPSKVRFREKVNLVTKGLFGCDPLSLTLHGNIRESIKPMEKTREKQTMW